MAIKEVTMYTAECDDCGYEPEFGDYTCLGDTDAVREEIECAGWIVRGNACLCEDCAKLRGITNSKQITP